MGLGQAACPAGRSAYRAAAEEAGLLPSPAAGPSTASEFALPVCGYARGEAGPGTAKRNGQQHRRRLPAEQVRSHDHIAPFMRLGSPPGPSNLTLPLSDHRCINLRYIFGILAVLTLIVNGRLRLWLYAQGYGSCFRR